MEGIKTMHTLWRRTLTCMRNLHEMEAITLLQITKATKNKGTSLEVASSGIARTRENMSMSFYSLKRKDISMRIRKRRILQRIAPCRLLYSVTHLAVAALRAKPKMSLSIRIRDPIIAQIQSFFRVYY